MTIGVVAGIPLRVHASFALLLLWVGFVSEPGTALGEIIFVLCIFLCVLVHELGHAITAKRFGVRTRDITLYPIGGIASLLDQPKPWAELWIALAGPAVNVVIAAILLPFVTANGIAELEHSDGLLPRLFEANIFLAVFNMIPAFPMDGGRVLRAVLALLKVEGATIIASRLSQIFSILLGLFALYTKNPVLVIIATFVFMQAVQQVVHEKARLGAEGRTVSEVMTERSKLQILTHGMTLTEALDIALRSVQPAFPVLLEEQIMGVVARETILQEAALSEEEQYISGFMQRDFLQSTPEEHVDVLVARLERDDRDPVVVVSDGKLVGMVYRDKLFEFLYLHGLRRARGAHNYHPDEHARLPH